MHHKRPCTVNLFYLNLTSWVGCILNTGSNNSINLSAYHEDHSTETMLLNVHHDIPEVLDKKYMAALVLLDLPTAFDVFDHKCIRNIHTE